MVWFKRRLEAGVPHLSAEGAALVRVVLGAALLALISAKVKLDLHGVDPHLLATSPGNGFGQWWLPRYLMVHPQLLAGVHWALLVLIGSFIVGLATRVAAVAIWIGLVLLVSTQLTMWGCHAWGLPLWALLGLALAPLGDAWSVDALLRRRLAGGSVRAHSAGRHYGFVIWWMGLVLGVAYAAAAVAKYRHSGLDWIFSGAVGYHFVEDISNAPTDWGLWVAARPWAAMWMSAFGFLVEALFVLVVFVRRQSIRACFCLLGLGLHLGFYLFQGIQWLPWVVLYISFLPYESLAVGLKRLVQPTHGWLSRSGATAARPLPFVGASSAVRRWQWVAVVLFVGQQVAVSKVKVECDPLFTYFPMYAYTHPSWEAFFDNFRWYKYQQYHFIAVDERGEELDLTPITNRIGDRASGPLIVALKNAAQGVDATEESRGEFVAAVGLLEREIGWPIESLIYRVDQQAIDFDKCRSYQRFANRYAGTFDVRSMRFVELDEAFVAARLPSPVRR